MKEVMFCIVGDNDGHKYIIHDDHLEFWRDWLESESDEVPWWAERLNGPINSVRFPSYEIV